jgi:hypothetical protein
MNLIMVMTVSNRKRNMFKNNTNDSNLNLVRSGQVLAPRQLSILGNAANFEAFQTVKRRAYQYIPEVATVLYFVFVSLEEIGGLTPPTEIKNSARILSADAGKAEGFGTRRCTTSCGRSLMSVGEAFSPHDKEIQPDPISHKD